MTNLASVPNRIMSGKIDDFASHLVLFERMEVALLQRLKTSPESETILYQLAVCKRKQGRLDEALQLYVKLSERYPRNTNYLYSIAALTGALDGTVLEEMQYPCICPIVEWSDFLPEITIQEMITHICQHQTDFEPAEVGGGKKHKKSHYNPDARNNTALPLKGNPLKKIVRNLIKERLPEITQRLGLAPFEASRTEVKLRAYHNGEYFRVHQDGALGRKISYTYFFHPEPKRFSGGEFVAFDTDTSSSTFNHAFTRILPKRNSVFFFPSHYYHAVLPVKTQDDDFMSARFVINGHIWKKTDTDLAEK